MKHHGIIDIGSNSIRLVLYENQRVLENLKVFAQLRKYLQDDGNLSETGIQTLLETLLGFQKVTRAYGVKEVICAATATIRQSRNQAAICQKIANETDFHIRIISEYEEAYFGALAVLNSTPLTDGITVDLGGGSTEITLIRNRKVMEYHSFPFGAVSLAQQFVGGQLPTAAELAAISTFARTSFGRFEWLKNCGLPIYAIGGSARNMARAHQMMTGHLMTGLHAYLMQPHQLQDVQTYLGPLSFEDLQKTPGIAKERASTIIPSIEVFIALIAEAASPSFSLSCKGFRNGLILEGRPVLGLPQIRLESIKEVVDSVPASKSAVALCSELVHLCPAHQELLRYGIALYNSGRQIDSDESLEHTFYLVTHKTLDGFTQQERALLALLASYQNRSKFRGYLEQFPGWFTKEEQHEIHAMGAFIKLIHCLRLQGRSLIQSCRVLQKKHQVHLTFKLKSHQPILEDQAQKQKKHLERVLKCEILITFI